jgi:hypothetical protein
VDFSTAIPPRIPTHSSGGARMAVKLFKIYFLRVQLYTIK